MDIVGSCFGDFRTPSASETLHDGRPAALDRQVRKASIIRNLTSKVQFEAPDLKTTTNISARATPNGFGAFAARATGPYGARITGGDSQLALTAVFGLC